MYSFCFLFFFFFFFFFGLSLPPSNMKILANFVCVWTASWVHPCTIYNIYNLFTKYLQTYSVILPQQSSNLFNEIITYFLSGLGSITKPFYQVTITLHSKLDCIQTIVCILSLFLSAGMHVMKEEARTLTPPPPLILQWQRESHTHNARNACNPATHRRARMDTYGNHKI